MTSSFRFASLYNAHFAGITINHILKVQDDMFSLLAIPLAQAISPSNFKAQRVFPKKSQTAPGEISGFWQGD